MAFQFQPSFNYFSSGVDFKVNNRNNLSKIDKYHLPCPVIEPVPYNAITYGIDNR